MVRLLLHHGADPNAMENTQLYTCNALLRAAAGGEVEIAQILIEGGGDPDVRDREGRTPLSYVAERGHVGVVGLLIGHGLSVLSRDAVRGWRALDLAVQGKILGHLTEGSW